MMTPKPLSTERRDEILKRLRLMEFVEGCVSTSDLATICDLLAAETFWREAVKDATGESDTGPSQGMCLTCNFCHQHDGPGKYGDGNGIVQHKADCPWLLAQ